MLGPQAAANYPPAENAKSTRKLTLAETTQAQARDSDENKARFLCPQLRRETSPRSRRAKKLSAERRKEIATKASKAAAKVRSKKAQERARRRPT